MVDTAQSSDVFDALWAVALELVVDQTTGAIRDLNRIPPRVSLEQVVSSAAHDKFMRSVLTDRQLAVLAPSGTVKWITGFEPHQVCQRLLNGALWWCFMREGSTADELKAELARHLDGLRSIVRTERASVWVKVVFGVHVPSECNLQSRWGVLRPWKPIDSYAFEDVELVPRGGTVLDGWLTFPLHLDPRRDPPLQPGAFLDDYEWLCVAAAILLMQNTIHRGRSGAVPYAIASGQVLDGGTSGGMAREMPFSPYFDQAQMVNLEVWLNRLGEQPLPDVAIHRLTSMVERSSDVDAFVDAVIVWEALFARGSTAELSYRLSTVMACVLSDNPIERVAYQQEIKKLYNMRSQVVHGGRHLTQSDAFITRQRAQQLTLSAVRRLVLDHPGLIGAGAHGLMAFVLGVNPGPKSGEQKSP